MVDEVRLVISDCMECVFAFFFNLIVDIPYWSADDVSAVFFRLWNSLSRWGLLKQDLVRSESLYGSRLFLGRNGMECLVDIPKELV